MSNLDLVWDDAAGRGDWQVTPAGRTSTGNLLRTVVWISIFTDRRAQPDYNPIKPWDGDKKGWWGDTMSGVPIGSRLWQLRRRDIADRSALAGEAAGMLREALQWMIDAGLTQKVSVTVTIPEAGFGRQGTMLLFKVELVQPDAEPVTFSTLWRAV